MKKLLWVLALILATVSGFCQTVIPSTPSASVTATTPKANDNLSSPQTTVQTFLDAMRTDDLSTARQTMDLSDVPFAVRDVQGNRYARILVAILARIPAFHPEALPTTTKQDSFSITVFAQKKKEIGHLVIDKDDNGNWQFSSSTVANLPHIYPLVQPLPQTGTIGYFSDPQLDPSMQVRAYLPAFMLRGVLWLELWQWLALLALLATSWLVFALLKGLLSGILKLFFRHWDNIFTRKSLRNLRRSAGVVAAATYAWALFDYIGLTGSTLLVFTVILKLVWIFSASWLLGALFDVVLDSLSARATAWVHRADRILIPIAKKFAKFVFFLLASLVFAASMSVNVAGLVAGLGIGGLVIALAGKDSVENIFGSFTILFDMPFGIGDWIKIGDTQGSVEEINLRSTRIRTGKDTVITLPNSNFIRASVENFGSRRYRNVNLTLPVSYVNSLEHVRKFVELVRNFMVHNEHIRPETANIQINTLDGAGMGVLLQADLVTTNYSEELQWREDLLANVVSLAAEAKVVLGPLSWNLIPPPPEVNPSPQTQP